MPPFAGLAFAQGAARFEAAARHLNFRLAAEEPEVTLGAGSLQLRVLATERVSRFHAEGVDLSIRYGQPPFGPGLQVQRLLENTLIAVGSPALVGDAGALPPKRLAKLPLIHDAHGSWPAFFAQAGLPAPAPGGTRFNQIGLAIDAAIAGQGLALASPFFVAPDIAAGRLVRVLPQVALRTGTDYHLVWPQHARGGEGGLLLDEVTAWLLQEAARQELPV